MNKYKIWLLLAVTVILFGAVFGNSAHAAGETCALTYTTEYLDMLGTIAQRYLGDVGAYTQIADATNAQNGANGYTNLTDPNTLAIGDKLCVPEAANAFAGLELSTLANATYVRELSDSATMTLKDGTAQEPIGDGSSYYLYLHTVAYGKVNGTNSAAVVTWFAAGGTQHMYVLRLMQVQDGALKQVGAVELGDRIGLNSVKIENGKIVVDIVRHQEGDADCCPTQHVINTLALDGGELKLGSTQGTTVGEPSATPTGPASASGSAPVPNNANGVTRIVGQAGSANAIADAAHFPEPSVALVDASNLIARHPEKFVPETGQILGALTTPLFPMPGKFQINLPIEPTGAYMDLDNNGKTDKGVQIYYMIVSSNIIGNSYLQQLEQYGGLLSYTQDTVSGEIEQGTFLVYAPDAKQSFPSGKGADGKWFTADDPTAPLEPGYTVAKLGLDGKVTLDRTNPGTINSIERAEVASPDFTKQGILESFNSLIDHLKTRYAYTEFRKLDWEKVRAQYLSDVQKADTDKDMASYYGVLNRLALSLRDAHVSANTTNTVMRTANLKVKLENVQGNVGATVIGISNPGDPMQAPGFKFVVLNVSDNTPAKEAGWVPGTEIVSIDGQAPHARFDEIPLLSSVGTQEAYEFSKTKYLLNFPISQTVEIAYRLPDAQEVMTATMTAGDYPLTLAEPPFQFRAPISYDKVGDYVVIRWENFVAPVLPKIKVLEMALDAAHGSSGVILDLRGNGGGWSELMDTMSSYFFTADKPFSTKLTDWYTYDADAGKLVLTHAVDAKLSSPKPELAYSGPLVVLVDAGCASACEYFSQHMQQMKRATVIGQYTTEGAGGPIDRIKMPGDIMLQYTVGKTTFAGTDELNLEAKGVQLDVRVPVTLASEQAKQQGQDPVLQAAIAELDKATNPATRLTANAWQWQQWYNAAKQPQAIQTPEKYTVTFAADGLLTVQADCNTAQGSYTLADPSSITITLGATTLAACAEGSQSEAFLKYLGAANAFAFDGDALGIVVNPDSGAFALEMHPAK